MANPQSTARIWGHPVHPMLIPFPIVFFVSAFACDLAFWVKGDPSWAAAAQWLLGAGLVMAALAALAGLIDFFGDRRIRDLKAAWLHAGGNIIAVLIEIVNFYIRYSQGQDAVLPWGLILSLAVTGILLFTGWMGWEMVYRHRVGVADDKGSPVDSYLSSL